MRFYDGQVSGILQEGIPVTQQNQITTKLRISAEEEIEVPLHFEMQSFVPSVLAQHMTIQGTADNILVSFFEANPPIMFNSTPQSLEKFKQEGYTAECVARIAIPVSRFGEFAEVFGQIAKQL
ncbi:MAG: hypothetical protein AAB401_14570, partial [Acidobacteriota bacterium]